jgi:hypothetical protein
MEQRPLRLGDILDDYCPRERRVTNHAIVAMVGDDVKQTRCTTCDADHPYKGGKQPRRKKKDAPAALYREVLAGMPDTVEAVDAVAADVSVPALVVPSPVIDGADADARATRSAEPVAGDEDEHIEDEQPEDLSPVEEGPVHRRLIRATLPRPEGAVKEARPIPEFTIHRSGARSGQFRGGHHRGAGNGNGQGNGQGNGHGQRSGRRFAGGGAGNGSGYPGRGGQGRPGGFRGGPDAQRPGGGGKKRSR